MAKKDYIKPVKVEETGNDLKGFFWEFTLYPLEDLEHKKTFDIFTSKDLEHSVRWITHDRDKWSATYDDNGKLIHRDGELKKSHVHMLWKSESRISIDKVSAISRVPTNLITRVNSVAVKAQYLLHKDVNSLFDDYRFKYADHDLHGGLPLIPNKWDDDYLFQHWGLFIRNTSLSWGDVVYYIGCAGHFRFLNKYRNLLKDIYFSSHIGNESLYNPYIRTKELEKCQKTELECLPLVERTDENGLI